MSDPVPYRKLPGRSASLRFGLSSAPASTLWLGPDHLLQTIQTPSREEYRRYDYRDIQEVFVQVTRRRLQVNLLLAALHGIVLGICLLANAREIAIYLIWSAPFVVGYLVNTLRGPCCQGYLLTAVGVEPLSSLARLGPARRAVDQLTTEIEQAQGRLEPATLAQHWQRSH